MTIPTIPRRMLFILTTLTLSVLLLASFACGDDDDDTTGDDTDATATEASGDDGGASTLDVTMTDNAFDPGELTAAAGADVVFNITNDGAAIHNLHIAGPDGEFDTDDDVMSSPEQVRAGETAALDWTAPDTAGTVDFRCDFHPAEMTGTITVE